MKTSTENIYVLNLVQALLGAVSNNFRAVSIKSHEKSIHIFFILEHESLDDREEITDIIFEF